jgi:hypothetical protein
LNIKALTQQGYISRKVKVKFSLEQAIKAQRGVDV